jgi:hypothetical protein
MSTTNNSQTATSITVRKKHFEVSLYPGREIGGESSYRAHYWLVYRLVYYARILLVAL